MLMRNIATLSKENILNLIEIFESVVSDRLHEPIHLGDQIYYGLTGEV